jgi:DNA-binding CsgD family transcriptional regulator
VFRDIFYELADDVERITTVADGDAFLKRIVENYGLRNVAYLGVNIPVPAQSGGVYVTTTYDTSWHARYLSREYARIDPVVQRGLRRIVPFDWAEFDCTVKPHREFFGESREFGVGRQGLTIPIRGAMGETALFSINADCGDNEWVVFRKKFIRDFQLIGFHFHAHVLQRENVEMEEINLAQRQIEILQWAASGKTEWETASICGISQRTVKYHLAGAITKLGAVNKVHAVAKAIKLNLL